MSKKNIIPLFDLTTTWSPERGWHSAAPDKLRWLTRHNFNDVTAQILRKMEEDYKAYGYQPQSFASRLHGRIWATKFNPETTKICLLVSDWLTDLAKKLIPSALADGITIILVHTSGKCGTFNPVYARQPADAERPDMAPVYAYMQQVEDWIAVMREEHINLQDLQADCQRLVDTAAVFGFFPESKGPITGAYQLRKILPPIETMQYMVENLGPLYDIEMPHLRFITQYETDVKINPDPEMGKYLRPNTTVRAPKNRYVQVEDQTELIICYMQIRWYLRNHIKPLYLWAETDSVRPYQDYQIDQEQDDDAFVSCKHSTPEVTHVRLMPTECYQLGLKGRLFRT